MHLQSPPARPYLHPDRRRRGARSHRVPCALHLNDAQPATAEGVEARIVAERGDLTMVPLRNLVDGLATAEGHFLAVEEEREAVWAPVGPQSYSYLVT